jgi:hypothetical protein
MGNLVLVKSDSTPPVIGDAGMLMQTLQAKKILKCTVEEIKQVLALVMVKIGLRADNWPEDEEKAILIDDVMKRYAGHTIAEIKLAFDLALDNKLNVEWECYENFSCGYLSKIMNAYRAWAKQEIKFLPTTPQIMIENKENISDKAMQGWLSDTVQKVKSGAYRKEFVSEMLFDWLARKGMINVVGVANRAYEGRAIDERRAALWKIREDNPTVANENNLKDFDAMIYYCCGDLSKVEGPEVNKVKSIAKRWMLYDLIQDGHFGDA